MRLIVTAGVGHKACRVGLRRAPQAGRGSNAHVRWLDAHPPIGRAARDLLASAAERMALTARGYHRVLKVAQTFAELDAADAIAQPHVAETLRYRPTR